MSYYYYIIIIERQTLTLTFISIINLKSHIQLTCMSLEYERNLETAQTQGVQADLKTRQQKLYKPQQIISKDTNTTASSTGM